VTLRSPGLLAKCVTTLDVLSRGRAVLGVGAGWDVAEHEAYGLAFPGTGERMDRLDETLAICGAMFRDKRATVSGAHYSVREAPNSPRPAGLIPVLVGGGGERRTLRAAARYADACNVFGGDAETVRHKFDVLERHCEQVGRDPAEITKTVFGPSPGDLAAFATGARALAAAGADGMIVIGPEDPGRIGAIGQVLTDVFPG
jgi:alkanesulfonate monooxygenase SsuD/methylene tetrahydromethanopterin reductase-like flavin-dependent oxidoreductase (luciferase family)